MDIHNTTEDIVFATMDTICETIEKSGNPEHICTCDQCRLDAACYTLNRSPPYYLVSNRGAARLEQENLNRQQIETDIAVLIYDGLKRVSHNQRPLSDHAHSQAAFSGQAGNQPVYNIPTIVGRIFNGLNFAPMSDITIELRQNGELVDMKNPNWQNPYTMVRNTEGTYTFWPTPLPADTAGISQSFEYIVQIDAAGFEPVRHVFQVPVISEFITANSFSMNRTFKLPDIYMFSLGGDEDD